MHINYFYNIDVSILSTYQIDNNNTSYKLLQKIIPIEWHLILMSDGSFTQNLHSLTGKLIKIKIIWQTKNKYISDKNIYLREIWLEDESEYKLTFAQSVWHKNDYPNILLPLHKPVGQSLIQLEKDIYKDIHEIYYGYSHYLNNAFHSNKAIWGRKYTIYSNTKPIATIKEFFSPHLIKLFKI